MRQWIGKIYDVVQARNKVKTAKQNRDATLRKVRKDGRNRHNQNYSMEAVHDTQLNILLGKLIQHTRRKIRAAGVKDLYQKLRWSTRAGKPILKG